MRTLPLLLLSAAAFAGVALAAPGDDLQTIIDEHWEWHLEQSPTTRTHQGDKSANDLQMWLARMEALPTLLAQHTELLQEGIRRQRVQALVVMQRVPAQIDWVVAGGPEESPFFKPFLERPEGVDKASFDRLQAFNEFLRSDPQFYYDTPEELLQGYEALSKRLDPELVQLFGRLPRMPYGVRTIPAEVAPDTTTAYYQRPALDGSRAGYYYVNLYRPEVRPKYEMEVLSVHEAVPGHHLQIALAQELEGLPRFRSSAGATAFIEGWALYSERLGYQMGLYQDPYSRYGQLTYDMWRAVRLVVDTGIHYMGWSRQQAIDYFKAHAGKTEADIINEIDRYIGWPGQALAYKIGQLKILELRTEAEQALGANFDIRAFHDELLGAGAIPLQLLEQRMDAWLAEQKEA